MPPERWDQVVTKENTLKKHLIPFFYSKLLVIYSSGRMELTKRTNNKFQVLLITYLRSVMTIMKRDECQGESTFASRIANNQGKKLATNMVCLLNASEKDRKIKIS